MLLKKSIVLLLAPAALVAACANDPISGPQDAAGNTGIQAITALGRLEPGLGVVEVGAPPGDRLLHLDVQEGDDVTDGQVLAVLESQRVRQAELELAEAARSEAQEDLRRARRLGPLAVATRQAEVRRLEADLELAKSDLARTEALVEEAVLPSRDLDFQRSVTAQALARLEQGQSQLQQERRSSKLEIRRAQAALTRATADVEAAAVRLERTEIRSPMDGKVLDQRLFAGEPTRGAPIFTLGEVRHMVAVAEIFETDARHVRVGQAAEITSPALPEPLRGTVEKMGTIVRRNDVLSLDPAARRDVRVIEARIRLEDPQTAASFVHLQVDIKIETRGEG